MALVLPLSSACRHSPPPCFCYNMPQLSSACITPRYFSLSHSLRQNLGYSAVSWDIQAPTDPSVPFVSCDVSSEAKVAAALSETVGKLGAAPSVLINNCGLQYMAPVTEFPLEKWNALLGIMVTGTFLCSKAVIPGTCHSLCTSVTRAVTHSASRHAKARMGSNRQHLINSRQRGIAL